MQTKTCQNTAGAVRCEKLSKPFSLWQCADYEPVELPCSADVRTAGNTAVVKPSAYAPVSANVLKDLLEECFPPEYVAVVLGGREENQALLQEKFDKIFSTGSVAVGKQVMESAARHLTPVTLELGGKSPCIVEKSSKIRLAARRIVFGKFINCGSNLLCWIT